MINIHTHIYTYSSFSLPLKQSAWFCSEYLCTTQFILCACLFSGSHVLLLSQDFDNLYKLDYLPCFHNYHLLNYFLLFYSLRTSVIIPPHHWYNFLGYNVILSLLVLLMHILICYCAFSYSLSHSLYWLLLMSFWISISQCIFNSFFSSYVMELLYFILLKTAYVFKIFFCRNPFTYITTSANLGQ